MHGSVPAARTMRAAWLLVLVHLALRGARSARVRAPLGRTRCRWPAHRTRSRVPPSKGVTPTRRRAPRSGPTGRTSRRSTTARTRTSTTTSSPAGTRARRATRATGTSPRRTAAPPPARTTSSTRTRSTTRSRRNVFLYLAFTRGGDTGTTYMAFELNQRSNLWNNGNGRHPVPDDRATSSSPTRSPGNSPDVILQKWTTTTADATTGCARSGKLSDFTAFTDNVDVQGGGQRRADHELPAVELHAGRATRSRPSSSARRR